MFSLNSLYTNNITYYYPNFNITITNGIITIYKEKGKTISNIYLLLNPGTYIVKHNYTSNTVITKYLSINNTMYGNNSIINIKNRASIFFVFDMLEEMYIKFNSIQFIQKKQNIFN